MGRFQGRCHERSRNFDPMLGAMFEKTPEKLLEGASFNGDIRCAKSGMLDRSALPLPLEGTGGRDHHEKSQEFLKQARENLTRVLRTTDGVTPLSPAFGQFRDEYASSPLTSQM